MKFSLLIASLAATMVAGQLPPAPSPKIFRVPSPASLVPSPAFLIPTPQGVIPSPKATVAPDGPAPAPGDLFNPSPDDLLANEPAPTVAPAPTVNPAPTIQNPAPDDDGNEPVVTGAVPAPEPALYFFCQTAVLCYDCDDKPINQQSYVATKWNDSYCDNGGDSAYNLNCELFKYDSGACATTTTVLTRKVYLNNGNSDPAITLSPSDGTSTGTDSMSTASLTAIIVCLAVAVVGGVTVVVFYVVKKNKEREYADFQA